MACRVTDFNVLPLGALISNCRQSVAQWGLARSPQIQFLCKAGGKPAGSAVVLVTSPPSSAFSFISFEKILLRGFTTAGRAGSRSVETRIVVSYVLSTVMIVSGIASHCPWRSPAGITPPIPKSQPSKRRLPGSFLLSNKRWLRTSEYCNCSSFLPGNG